MKIFYQVFRTIFFAKLVNQQCGIVIISHYIICNEPGWSESVNIWIHNPHFAAANYLLVLHK